MAYESITIVVPAYNEEKSIKNTLKKINSYCRKRFKKYEMIVVDDGSKDKTALKASQLKNKHVKVLVNPKNRGKGFSVRRGLLEANYPLVMFTDSDLATPIEELDKLLKETPETDIVIASRNLPNSKIIVKQPFHRRVLGRLFSLIVRLATGLKFKDTQCGFKIFKTKAAKAIAERMTIDRFSFDVEMLIIARRKGFSVKEVPVIWINDEDSRVNALRDSARMFSDIVKIRCRDIAGKYR
jgi:dolichyl-phosphate beta-glucosyltransferase